MKKLFIIAIMSIVAIGASAQITWNAKGGVGIAHCWGNEDISGCHFVGKFGAGIEMPVSSNWSIMPSLELAWKGAKESFEESGSYSDFSYDETLDIFYIQVPVLAAYRINIKDNWNMTLKAGPYFAVGVYGNMTSKWTENGESHKDKVNIFKGLDDDKDGYAGANRFDMGLDLGVDFEYRRFVFGVEYELGFMNINAEGESLRNGAAYFTVGYKF